ncbi:hypothetical protein BME99_10855 [Pseudomonas protegens]|nr:hypothetical protein BME99_10855 [Pseudomonas protegens]
MFAARTFAVLELESLIVVLLVSRVQALLQGVALGGDAVEVGGIGVIAGSAFEGVPLALVFCRHGESYPAVTTRSDVKLESCRRQNDKSSMYKPVCRDIRISGTSTKGARHETTD